jgi:hypothetical protein
MKNIPFRIAPKMNNKETNLIEDAPKFFWQN